MIGDGVEVDEKSQPETRLARAALRLLAHHAIVKAREAADATNGNALASVRQSVLNEKLAATVRVEFPADADVFFEEIERMLMTIDRMQGGSSSGDSHESQKE
ncbi:hypothetical protein [Paraburkholderia dinghuensis]|uniref:Uncharacterized protein n=1 Tax=Paraburkholderia dinghuensis TaxID=2305225 RepID=A0A3N6NY69_9BURK|nr:hypothetical protein [Paraburkholderia dinghuensis]RQH05793.1 hypothetical protein D1Y85_14375 [Paraburkholderia dinghuensis]